jgi:hypothetical protein
MMQRQPTHGINDGILRRQYEVQELKLLHASISMLLALDVVPNPS